MNARVRRWNRRTEYVLRGALKGGKVAPVGLVPRVKLELDRGKVARFAQLPDVQVCGTKDSS